LLTIGRRHETEGHGGQVTNDPAGHLAGAPIESVSNRITHVKKGSFVNRQANLRTNNLDLVKHSRAVLEIDREALPIL
jgi:hypothetical protein